MGKEILVFNAPGGGITNDAPEDTLPKSDSEGNLVASRITDAVTDPITLSNPGNLLGAGADNVQPSAVTTGGGDGKFNEYYVVAVFPDGSTTGAGVLYAEVPDGPATLDLTHYTDLSWPAVAEATLFRVYTDFRESTPVASEITLLSEQAGTTFRDNGVEGEVVEVFEQNTTGEFTARAFVGSNVVSSGTEVLALIGGPASSLGAKAQVKVGFGGDGSILINGLSDNLVAGDVEISGGSTNEAAGNVTLRGGGPVSADAGSIAGSVIIQLADPLTGTPGTIDLIGDVVDPTNTRVTLNPATKAVDITANASTGVISLNASTVKIATLSTSDPGIANQLWNNLGVVMVSNG